MGNNRMEFHVPGGLLRNGTNDLTIWVDGESEEEMIYVNEIDVMYWQGNEDLNRDAYSVARIEPSVEQDESGADWIVIGRSPRKPMGGLTFTRKHRIVGRVPRLWHLLEGNIIHESQIHFRTVDRRSVGRHHRLPALALAQTLSRSR